MTSNGPTPDMQDLAARLIAYEGAAGHDPVRFGAFHVCEKMRRPLSTLAGSAGFRALFMRALTLAQIDAKPLSVAEVKVDGRLDGLEKLSPDEAQECGLALVAQLISLLVTFIGESLTLQLINKQWPDLPASEPARSQIQ